jgi:prephenate dehydratase
MRIGYLGPPGTFSEEALRGDPSLPGGAEPIPLPTVHGVVVAVADGEVDRALVPIENSLEGSVNEAVDALVHDAPGVRIIG